MNLIKKTLLYLYIFFVIYTPVFGSSIFFDKYIVLYVLMVFMLIPYGIFKDNGVSKILGNRNVLFLMGAVFVSSLYYVGVQILSGIDITSFSDLRLIQNNIIIVLIVHVAIIIDKLKKNGYNRASAFELLLKIAALQGLIALLALFIPYFKEMSVAFYQAAGGFNEFVIQARIYGISSDYTFGTPVYHGLLAGLAVYFAIKERHQKYYLYIPFIMLVTFLNGRTGIVVFLLVAVLSASYLYIRKGQLMKVLFAFLVLGFTVVGVMAALERLSPSTYVFIDSFIQDTRSLVFDGKLTGNYDVLVNDSTRFPENERFITGEGYRVYDGKITQEIGFRSDIGFVNDMYMGGLIFSLLLYFAVFAFLMYRSGDNRFMFALIIAVLLLTNIKGEVFRSSTVMFLVIYIKIITQSMQEKPKRRLR